MNFYRCKLANFYSSKTRVTIIYALWVPVMSSKVLNVIIGQAFQSSWPNNKGQKIVGSAHLLRASPGNTNQGRRLSTVDLLIKASSF
jgi:hypothetical protein